MVNPYLHRRFSPDYPDRWLLLRQDYQAHAPGVEEPLMIFVMHNLLYLLVGPFAACPVSLLFLCIKQKLFM
jgi:hypothetical protein